MDAMLGDMLKNVRERAPRIHSITNLVTMNDCANVLLSCGASPIMALAPQEVEEITSRCDGLNINLGTLQTAAIESMVLAGKKANELSHPVVLDPVGVGASSFRTQAVERLLEEVHFSIIRGNASEIKALAHRGSTQGVDAGQEDEVKKEMLFSLKELSRGLAERTGAVIVMTGAIDMVSDQKKTFLVYNGRPEMRSVTGCGCQLSALTAAFAGANQEHVLEAALAAVCTMGYAGEVACERMGPLDGNVALRGFIIDAIYRMTPESLEKGARYEVY